MIRPIATLTVALLLTAAATAHEFWIAPSTFSPEPGSPFRVTLMHGERFAGEPVPRDDRLISRYELVCNGDAVPVLGLSGKTTGYAKASAESPSILVYQSEWISNELGPERFESYLREERLHKIAELRATAGETGEPGREQYMRCAKALLGSADARVGLPCEIVLEAASGGSVSARVLLEGRPLAGATVVAVSRDNPADLVACTSDPEGLVRFETQTAGVWMLTTLHMQRALPGEGCDWRSFWVSSVFEIE